MNFPHLQGREKLLEPLGFTPQQAEWLTLVCLHSGLFTRDQAEAFLQSPRRTAQRFVHALLEARISGRPVADAQTADARRIYRIYGKAIYRELGLANVRHRREASIEVTRRRLLSLDFVLDHPDLPWLATEQEKVACFERLGIDPELFPKRIYAGRANGRVRYFHIKMPVAVEQDRAVFAYIDPGMGTPTELHSWGAAHRRLWDRLRESGRRIELVAVAWEEHVLDRAERVFQSWRGRAISDAEQEAVMLRQAIADTDWETLERHGGIHTAVEKVIRSEQETGSPDDRGMIDDFHLWGSRRCQQMGVTLSEGGWTLKGDMLLTTTMPFSQRAPLAVVVRAFPETPHQTRDNTDYPRPLRKSEARLSLACPPLARRNGAPHERGAGGESDPPFFGAGAARGRSKGDRGCDTLCPPPWGGRSLHSDPCGKAEMKTWSQVILVNLALTAVGLRVWLDPWPALGEVPLLDLVHATDPLMYAIFAAVHISTPGFAVFIAGLLALSIWRIWLARWLQVEKAPPTGSLPPWPITPQDDSPSLVVGEVHHPIEQQEIARPEWLVIPERGLYTGISIFGAVGSGNTSACMHPFAEQLLSWAADDPRRLGEDGCGAS